MPMTTEQHEATLHMPALCELLPIRDFLDDVMVRTDGSFVAGYELGGIHSYYHTDEARNQTKFALEALIRSLPERSMRMQVRFEQVEGLNHLSEQYKNQLRTDNPALQALDRTRLAAWIEKERSGFYLRPLLHAYFYWNPRIHHEAANTDLSRKLSEVRGAWSMSAEKCIQRTRREHEDLLSEMESMMRGIEHTLIATGMSVRRLGDGELFLEFKRALNPLLEDRVRYKRPWDLSRQPRERAGNNRVRPELGYRSARGQAVNTHIEDDQETYLKIGGLLYSFLSLKDLPDSTYPGILRELLTLDFPFVVNTEISIPDQASRLKLFKGRLRRMMAAQRDSRGGFRINVDAQVAQDQLIKVLQDLISSSLKSAQVSVVIGVRTSQPIESRRDREKQERILAERRQRVEHAVLRMNGARALREDLAKRRLYINGLPGMTEVNKREHDCFTLHGADLVMVESPWRGTPQSPLILLETPYRQLVPFSPFDPSLSDANVLITAKSGGGKTFLAQLLLTMMARLNPLISILERGNSYRPLVELIGGRCIDVDLEGAETLNAWDLPAGTTTPSKDKIAFLKNLTRHMIGIGDSHADTALLDNLLTDAIVSTYQRCRTRVDRPIPTFNDLREELVTWRDESDIERIRDEAQLAAVKLREWTGEKVYARLFDRHTTIRTDDNWLFFNVEGLTNDPKLESAMSMIIAQAMAERASGRTGQPNITVLDECWSLLDSEVLAPQVEQLFRTGRKRGASIWGISQALEDFVGTETNPRPHGPGIVNNASTKILGQQHGDLKALEQYLHLNATALHELRGFGAPRKGTMAQALLVLGEKAETTQTICIVPTSLEYWVCTTFKRERLYRDWFLKTHRGMPLLQAYEKLAERFPKGLAEIAELPEEQSGVGAGRAARAMARG
jgi:type IV secretory pathway VirB4 component